jgi:CDP-paratose 2-epimerase
MQVNSLLTFFIPSFIADPSPGFLFLIIFTKSKLSFNFSIFSNERSELKSSTKHNSFSIFNLDSFSVIIETFSSSFLIGMIIDNDMKVLITGGCGFIGSNIAIFLKKKIKKSVIHSLDNLSRNSSKINLRRLKKKKIKNFNADISNIKKINSLIKYDIIIDCCAEASVEASKTDTNRVFFTNLVGTFNILEKAKKDKSKIIFLSTSRVYSINKICAKAKNINKKKYNFKIDENFSKESPISLYGFTKLSSERLIQEYFYSNNLKYIINRFGVVSGPWQFGKQDQGFISLWLWRHLNKKKLSYVGFDGLGNQVRDVIHVYDVCELILEQINKIDKINNKIFNVGGGIKNSISLKQLTSKVQKITKNNIKIGRKLKTSIYDIPYYVTNNKKIYYYYNWRVKKNIDDILNDTFQILSKNKQSFIKLEK